MAADGAVIDAGLRGYMLRVYNWMASGLVLTGLVAYAVANTSLIDLFYQRVETMRGIAIQPTLLGYAAIFAPLVFVMVLSFGVNRLSRQTTQLLFWVFSALMGVSLSSIFLVYTHTSIVRVFFITAATFGALSLYGYTTKRDMTGFGSFLFMGLIGIVIASFVNLFLGSSTLQFAVSIIGVFVFAGLTAWDTQRLKSEYIYGYASAGGDIAERAAITGALSLYLNFINLFTLLLQLLGQRD
ncbi:MAG: Bax inhibitor-1/YccA family protein [Bradyrhizobium sp.]|nr:Bax inhibitor-1/YccA family protein [Bradyrhizobium sp.]